MITIIYLIAFLFTSFPGKGSISAIDYDRCNLGLSSFFFGENLSKGRQGFGTDL